MELLIVIGIIIALAVGTLLPIYDQVWGVNPSPAKPFIPLLNWEERSDWLNVKTDINPPAEGDGISDDTEALQSALNAMESGSILFLPPGTYRITKTLVLQGKDRGDRIIGGAIIGCGRETRIIWDGPADQETPMLLVKSGMCHIGRYIGIVWDGRGKAGIGIEHRSDRFETEVVHQHEAFFNFTNVGVRIGYGRQQTAEIRFENCLFANCGIGLAYLNFNDYNITVDGCEFRDCRVGVMDLHGNGYIRNCHFENSKECDLRLHSEHGSSIRRCTSLNSRAFLHFTSYVAPLTVQQCSISGWKNPDGPFIFGNDHAPVIIMDTIFSNPPNSRPPILVTGQGQIILSNNHLKGGGVLLGGKAELALNIPAGKEKVVELPADMSFLKEKVDIPGKVFDAKRDFGARGDGKTDDTRAIQKTIDSARKWGRGAIAYLPKGDYVITKTIKITGSDYYIGGCGSQTNIIWQGEEGGIMFHIHDPDHIVLENLSMGWKNVDTKEGLNILQTSSGKPSFMIYDGVYVYGMYQDKPGVKGLQLRGLSKDSTVIIRHLCGNIRITDSSQARILVNASYNGNLLLEGKDKMRNGFIGFLTRFTPDKPYTLYVRDNQSLVMSDYYVEQGEQYAIFEGGENDPPGYVVIQGAKIHCWGKYSKPTIVVKDYKGTILLGHNQFYDEPKPSEISIRGSHPCDLVLLGVEWYPTEPAVKKAPSSQARVYAFGCEVKSWKGTTDKPMEEKLKEIFDVPKESTLEKVALGLDKLRLLGELDLKLNHPTVWNILQRRK